MSNTRILDLNLKNSLGSEDAYRVYSLLGRTRPQSNQPDDKHIEQEIRKASREVNGHPSQVRGMCIEIIAKGVVANDQVHNIVEHLDFIKNLIQGVEAHKGLNVWLGQGVSHVNGEAIEPIDVVRDYLWLRNFSQSQLTLANPTAKILVADELEKYDGVSPEVIAKAADNRMRLLEACGRLWPSNVKIDLASRLLPQGEYQDTYEDVNSELGKQPSLREMLRETIPKRYAERQEAMRYSEHEVTLAIYYARLEDIQVKLGNPSEAGYDKVIRAISSTLLRSSAPSTISAIHLRHVPLTGWDMPKSKIGISYRAKSLQVENPKEERILITDTLGEVREKLGRTYGIDYYRALAHMGLDASGISKANDADGFAQNLSWEEKVSLISKTLHQQILEPLQRELR